MLSGWVILLFVFSTPERDTSLTVGGLDVIGISKAVSRLGTLALLAAINLMMVGKISIKLVVGDLVSNPLASLAVTCIAMIAASIGDTPNLASEARDSSLQIRHLLIFTAACAVSFGLIQILFDNAMSIRIFRSILVYLIIQIPLLFIAQAVRK